MKVFAANTVRTYNAAKTARLVLALVILLGVGCRSRSERDLVERELRMHEDQIYALEDYLEEYQEIVRRCRCENQELKRELEQLRASSPDTPTQKSTPPQGATPDDTWSPDRPRTRSLLDRPRAQDQPDPFKDDTPETLPPTTPEIEIDVVEPEIELGTPVPVTPSAPAPERGTSAPPRGEPAPPAIVPTQVLSDAQPLLPASEGQTDVYGEFVRLANYEEPSLHVEVRPRTADGNSLDYHGALEVMLLDPTAGPTAPALARWEFTPEEVEQAWRDPEAREVFDVLAGLPDGLPLERPIELWIRMLPSSGGKVLASTIVRLREDVSEEPLDLEAQSERIDSKVMTAGHWVPSDSEIAPKQSSSANSAGGGWLPQK